MGHGPPDLGDLGVDCKAFLFCKKFDFQTQISKNNVRGQLLKHHETPKWVNFKCLMLALVLGGSPFFQSWEPMTYQVSFWVAIIKLKMSTW